MIKGAALPSLLVWAAPSAQSSPSSDQGPQRTKLDPEALLFPSHMIVLEVENDPMHYRHRLATGLPCNRRNAR